MQPPCVSFGPVERVLLMVASHKSTVWGPFCMFTAITVTITKTISWNFRFVEAINRH